MIVADTNVISYLVIEGVHTDQARAAYERDPQWVLPALWRSEFLNVLTLSMRTGILNERQALTAWRNALSLVQLEHEVEPLLVLRYAVRQVISAYDSQFVMLAHTLGIKLVTADKQLVRRCSEYAVLLEDFSAGHE